MSERGTKGRGRVTERSDGAPEERGVRWSFMKQTIESIQKKESRFPATLLRPLSEWAARQEKSGFMRIWSPAAAPEGAGDLWFFESRDVRLDPFFFTSLVLHLLLALLFWRAIEALPTIEPPEKEEVIIKLEEFLPKVDAGQAAAKPAPVPEPPRAAARPSVQKKIAPPKATAPKPSPRPTPVTPKPAPTPEPEPVLVPKTVTKPKSISLNAPVAPTKTPTDVQRLARATAPHTSDTHALGAGTSAADIDVDRGGGAGVRGPVGPVSVPDGRGAGSGSVAGRGTGTSPGASLLGLETDPDFAEYFEKVERKVKRTWRYPPGVLGQHKVVLRFKLDPGARAYDVSVRRSTNAKLNDSAIDAMRRGSPFPPIPQKLKALIGRPLMITVNIVLTQSGS